MLDLHYQEHFNYYYLALEGLCGTDDKDLISYSGQCLTDSPCDDGSLKATEVIELTDDEEKQDDQIGENQIDGDSVGRLIWYYEDPQGKTQGPFSTASLKRWSDDDYFPPDFKVWKNGESQENSVLLSDMLQQIYTG